MRCHLEGPIIKNPQRQPCIVVIVGTRPEAIKIAPVWRALERLDRTRNVLVSSGQHAGLLTQTLAALELSPEYDLKIMQRNQSPASVLSRVLESTSELLTRLYPDAVVVQGDTTTVLGSALAAFHLKIPIAHIEAGLRTYDFDHPFPEEANRQLVDRLSRWCFAPTEVSRSNLLQEFVSDDRIVVTGNTAVDNLLWMTSRISGSSDEGYLLVTLHRRESFGEGLRDVLLGVADFVNQHPEARVMWPVHPNPAVASVASEIFSNFERVRLTEPLDYREFVGVLMGARTVLTDSGGIQEEAPSLGKTVLVARDKTERPEALQSGTNRLIGRTRQGVSLALAEAWSQPTYAGPLPAPNPFGDGQAGERIATRLVRDLCAGIHDS